DTMMKRPIFLAITAAVVVWGSGAREARATSVLLSQVLGTTVNIDGLDFEFKSYTTTGGAPAADAVTITYPSTSSNTPSFTLTGSFGALAGANQDADLVYTVTGKDIDDVTLGGNPTALGSPPSLGIASVSDTVASGTAQGGPTIGSVAISSVNPPGIGPL